MRWNIPFWWFIYFYPGAVAGQVKDLAFQHLNQENGLSQSLCTYTSRDSKGFIWIGTIDGLNRFDGQKTFTYRPDPSDPGSIEGNNITSACYEDLQGDLWFTTNNAIHRYDYATDKFEIIHVNNTLGEVITEDYYAFYFERQGRLWYRAGDGEAGFLHVYDCTTRRDSVICRLGAYKACALTDAAGTVTGIAATMYRDQMGFEVISLVPPFNRTSFLTLEPVQTNKAIAEGDSVIWVAASTGLIRFHVATQSLKLFPATGAVYDICPFGDTLLFVSSIAQGLLVFSKKQHAFIRQFNYNPTDRFSLQSNETRELFIDNEQNLWVSQWGKGLTFVNLKKNKFEILPETKGVFTSVITPVAGGKVLCNTGAGIFIYSQQHKLLHKLNTQISGVHTFIALKPVQREKILFYDQYNHFFSLDTIHWKLTLFQTFPDSIQFRQAITLPSGKRLMACKGGLYEIEKNKYNQFTFNKINLKSGFAFKGIGHAFTDRSGHLFVTNNSAQVVIFKETPAGLEWIKTITGVGDTKAFWETDQTGHIWIAGTLGLLYLTPDFQVRLLNETTDGLHNETFYAVLPDRSGRLWLPGNSGLWCYDPAKKSSHCYQPVDGLFFSEFNTGAFYQQTDGTIWVGGIGGLVVFHPDSIRLMTVEPRIQFTRFMINDQPDTSGLSAAATTFFDLPYDQNTISFEFVGIDFSDPSAIQYQYRLVGYDDTWVTSGKRGFVRYANLPPGNYTLEVKASNSDGVWSEQVKQFNIHIQTPFWQTWWFYLLCLCFVSGLIYGWFRYRLHQAVKLERIRVQISSDLHDDVGTLLAGLAMQSEALEVNAAETDKNKLRRISEMSRNAMSHMRDTVWAIDARKDKFENLIDRMREHAEETLTPRDIRFRIDADPALLKRNLPTQLRQNLYLIFKEAVTNAARHTNGDLVEIHLQKTDRGLELQIADNGTVVEKGYKTTGSGTSNMQMRAEKIGGKLEISRKQGFCVTLLLPGKV